MSSGDASMAREFVWSYAVASHAITLKEIASGYSYFINKSTSARLGSQCNGHTSLNLKFNP